jgi:hypothetical protein
MHFDLAIFPKQSLDCCSIISIVCLSVFCCFLSSLYSRHHVFAVVPLPTAVIVFPCRRSIFITTSSLLCHGSSSPSFSLLDSFCFPSQDIKKKKMGLIII